MYQNSLQVVVKYWLYILEEYVDVASDGAKRDDSWILVLLALLNYTSRVTTTSLDIELYNSL